MPKSEDEHEPTSGPPPTCTATVVPPRTRPRTPQGDGKVLRAPLTEGYLPPRLGAQVDNHNEDIEVWPVCFGLRVACRCLFLLPEMGAPPKPYPAGTILSLVGVVSHYLEVNRCRFLLLAGISQIIMECHHIKRPGKPLMHEASWSVPSNNEWQDLTQLVYFAFANNIKWLVDHGQCEPQPNKEPPPSQAASQAGLAWASIALQHRVGASRCFQPTHRACILLRRNAS